MSAGEYRADEGPQAWKPRLRGLLQRGHTAGLWMIDGTSVLVLKEGVSWSMTAFDSSDEQLLTRQKLIGQQFATRREAIAALQLAWLVDRQADTLHA